MAYSKEELERIKDRIGIDYGPPPQIGGDHYQRLSPQPIEVIEAWGLPFHLANVVKYIARAGNKEGVSKNQDLDKALWYLKRYRQIHESPAG